VRATLTEVDDAEHGRFLGRVLNAGSGAPVPGAELVFSHEGSAESITADAHGNFRFTPAAQGAYQLAMASAPNFFAYAPEWEQSPIALVARPGLQVEGIDVYLTPAIDYQGRVVDQTGEPVVGARISISSSREAAMSDEEDALRSDAKGEFMFHARDFSMLIAKHEKGEGRALVDRAVQISHRLDIVIGQGPVLPPNARAHQGEEEEEEDAGRAWIRGKVVDAHGQAIPAFNVMLSRQSGLSSRPVAQRAVFDGAGTFRFDGLSEGPYRVHVTASGWAMQSAGAVAKETGGEPVTLELSKGASVYGKVLDEVSREPLSLAKVSLESSFGGGNSARPMLVSAVTNEEGEFELSGLRPGRRSVYVAAANHHTRIVSALEISDGARVGPLEVELAPVAEGDKPRLELAGIGVMLGAEEEGMLVRDLIGGGGAEEAGVLPEDLILAIDGKKVSELGWDDSIQSIRGPVGTQVQLRLRRGEEELVLMVTRRSIRT
jgi:hypothetical protein